MDKYQVDLRAQRRATFMLPSERQLELIRENDLASEFDITTMSRSAATEILKQWVRDIEEHRRQVFLWMHIEQTEWMWKD